MADTGHSAALESPASGVEATTTAPHAGLVKRSGLLIGLAALVAIILLPQPEGLSVAGQHMLGVFAFAVIVWMTEAVDYAASSIILLALMAFLLGVAPDPAHPGHLLGTHAALSAALAGFTNSAVALIAAALVIAAAMAITGLDKRVAYKVIALIGTSRSRILIGTIIIMALLAFFIPTASARVACLTPIMLGMISALGIDKKSRTAGMLMLAVAYLSLIWAIGIATGAAQNVYVNALMDRTIHVSISWIDWLIVGAPFSIAMSVALYVVLMKVMAPDATETAAAKNIDPAALHSLARELGPMTAAQKKLLLISLVLVGFWATQGKLHHFDSSSVAVAAVALMFVPGIGVLEWKQVQSRFPWGILVQLGVGVGLGIELLRTGAAGWLASFVVNEFGVQHLSIFAILAILWLFLIVVHLGFASGAAMATTMIPVMLSVLQQAQIPTNKIAGMTMLLAFVTSVGWILPINGPQNMLAFGTGTFEARDFIRVGTILTVIAYAMLLLFAATYWHWLGYV
jgi:solute carrier family 13 (sodium-dependent dicarboxylate transporter), member 2/3/5